MTIQQAIDIIKPEAHTIEAVKSSYRVLAKKYHPDVNPDGLEIMKLVNSAFDVLCERFNEWTLRGFEPEVSVLDSILDIFDKIKHCVGIQAEVCGTWLWITGNTRAYKDVFKAVGMKWSNNKVAWYWHPGGYRKKSRKVLDLNSIRGMFGSVSLDTEPMEAIA